MEERKNHSLGSNFNLFFSFNPNEGEFKHGFSFTLDANQFYHIRASKVIECTDIERECDEQFTIPNKVT